MENKKKFHPIQVIRHHNSPNRAQLPNGEWVERQEKLFIPEWGRFVVCADYSDHFIFELPKKYEGPTYQCTCGAAAIISGYSAYKDDASQQGLLFICLNHSTFGVHATGGIRWI
jgi:hypothetical protein